MLNTDSRSRSAVGRMSRDAGATSAGWTLLRLPGAVKDVFEERLRASLPLAADKVLHRIRETRGGEKLYDPRFHARGRGQGVYAEAIAAMFETAVKRLGFDERNQAVDQRLADEFETWCAVCRVTYPHQEVAGETAD